MVSDLRQMYLTDEAGPTYGCPDHPDWCMAAIVQQFRQAPVTITKSESGLFDIETSPISEFVHDMTTETTIAYTCGNPDCGFSVSPEQLGELKERHGRRPLGY